MIWSTSWKKNLPIWETEDLYCMELGFWKTLFWFNLPKIHIKTLLHQIQIFDESGFLFSPFLSFIFLMIDHCYAFWTSTLFCLRIMGDWWCGLWPGKPGEHGQVNEFFQKGCLSVCTFMEKQNPPWLLYWFKLLQKHIIGAFIFNSRKYVYI